MKSVFICSVLVFVLFASACVKNKEPKARICEDNPIVITTADTIELENCSDHYDAQRWDLPNGAFSTQKKVDIASNIPASYLIKLSVTNNDFRNNYIVERKLKIVSKTFTTSTLTATLPSANSEITICTVADDIDVTDPDGYYTSKGAPAGYRQVADLGNGCYTYALEDPLNPPSGTAVTYHYFCINDDGGFCDSTRVEIKYP